MDSKVLLDDRMTYWPGDHSGYKSALAEQVRLLQDAGKEVVVLTPSETEEEYSIYSNIEPDDAAEHVYFAGQSLESFMEHRQKEWARSEAAKAAE